MPSLTNVLWMNSCFSCFLGDQICIVGHAGSPEVCTRIMLGKTPRLTKPYHELVKNVPYCGVVVCEENKQKDKWLMVQPPIASFQHGFNSKFDWQCLH